MLEAMKIRVGLVPANSVRLNVVESNSVDNFAVNLGSFLHTPGKPGQILQ